MFVKQFTFRNCVLIAGLVMATLAGRAQSAPSVTAASPVPATTPAAVLPLQLPSQVPGPYKEYLKQRYAGNKQALAVIHLFGRKQTGGLLWLLTGTGFISYVASQTGTTTNSSGTTTVTVTPIGYGLMLGLFGGVGIGKLTRFGNTRLYEALRDYDRTPDFSGFIMGKLKDKDYK